MAPPKSSSSQEKAVALFDYTAQNPLEATIEQGEEVRILASEIQGWVKVQSKMGEGIVPLSYIKIEESAGTRPGSAMARSRTVSNSPNTIGRQTTVATPSALKDTDSMSTMSGKIEQVKALYTYEPTCSGELKLEGYFYLFIF